MCGRPSHVQSAASVSRSSTRTAESSLSSLGGAWCTEGVSSFISRASVANSSSREIPLGCTVGQTGHVLAPPDILTGVRDSRSWRTPVRMYGCADRTCVGAPHSLFKPADALQPVILAYQVGLILV